MMLTEAPRAILFIDFYNCIYLFLSVAALGLRCCAGLSEGGKWGLPATAVAFSWAAEHRL